MDYRRGTRIAVKGEMVELYAILRRGGWQSGTELGEAVVRSMRVGDEEMSDQVRWIRTYVLDEVDGSLGTVCIFEAMGPHAIRAHAVSAGLPCDEILRVAETVIVRPDPDTATT